MLQDFLANISQHLPSPDFRLMAITPPEPIPGEAERIAFLLGHGIERVHLRHPGASRDVVEKILAEIPDALLGHISLHDHHELASVYRCGVHLNSRHPDAPQNHLGVLSAGCHSVAELAPAFDKGCHYCFLSPVFDSISKPGYKAAITLDCTLRQALDSRQVIALGGVTPERLTTLADHGFAGAAMLGALWLYI